VFLTSDGISDNFDPVVTKIALPSSPRKLLAGCDETKSPVRDELKQVSETVSANEVLLTSHVSCSSALIENNGAETADAMGRTNDAAPSFVVIENAAGKQGLSPTQAPAELLKVHNATTVASDDNNDDSCSRSKDGRPIMTPCERHQYAVKEMERIVLEFELFTESACSAQELTGALVQHVLKLTNTKRKVLENPELYRRRRRLEPAERERRDAEIVAQLAKCPGKLDHATVVAYEVGDYHGDEDEDYCIDDDVSEGSCVSAEPENCLQSPPPQHDNGDGCLEFKANHFT
jgi:hypothetical protein